MAVASVSVILTVVVLKLHHCSPNQKKIPRWVRHYLLGYTARIVRCSCIGNSCPFLPMRKVPSTEADMDMNELQTKLLRQVESITQNSGNTCLNRETISRNHVNTNARNTSVNDTNNSKVNLDLRDYSACISNRSSSVDDESSINLKRDKSASTMEDILKFLKILVVKSDAEEAETDVVNEWKQVALVVDRLFFWLFLLITIFSTVIILVIVPSFKYIEDDGK